MQPKLRWLSKPQTQSLIAFSISTFLHVTACIALGFILISGLGNEGNALHFDVNETNDSDEIAQLDFTLETPVNPDAPIVARLDMSVMSTDVSLPETTAISSIGRDELPSNVSAQAAAAARTGGTLEVVTHKSGSRASFFGAQADGNKFVFVIDSSGSMRGPRWEALCKELIRAIKSLSPDQDFFVISFDSMAHPMFGTMPPKGKFLKAVDKNVDRIRNWLRSIQHGNQTLPASSVGIAMKLEPDAIFLLSDGEIKDSTLEDLRIWNRKQNEDGDIKTIVPIHTVLLHSLMGYATLEAIARENGGTFTPVPER